MREQIAQQPPLKRRATAEQGRLLEGRRSATASPLASPQGAGHYAGLHPEDAPYQSQNLPRSLEPEEEDDITGAYYPQRAPLSSRRYRPSTDEEVYEQGNRRLVVHHGPPPRRRKRQFPWLFSLGLGMLIMLAGWVLLSNVSIWWLNQQNQWTYGYPRTYQTDAVVGHQDSAAHPSHFIALNLDGHIQIIEIPGSDASQEKVYLGPTLFSDTPALVPVTLSFQDVNGDGKPDMLLHIQEQTIIFLNTGSQFKAAKK